MTSVLVVDDKEMMRDSVCATLRRAGFEVAAASDGQAALEHIARKRPDAVVTDLKMPKMTGVELVGKIGEIDDDLPVIVMTAFATIETAVDAIKRGAYDYITKPFEGDELIISLKRGLEFSRVRKENQVLRVTNTATRTASGTPAGPTGLDRLIGDSQAMRQAKQEIAAVAQSHGTVLIGGESGTGKEVVARAIHDLSPRTQGPLLAVNCAALSESLLESELFGHERGAFTGAEKLRKGRFELADGGTLLLDEVSEISPAVQAKLLRVLQERAFERVGSSLTIGVDVRVLATSNRDLPASAAKGDFREDLYFRLSVLPVRMPPLRERTGDAALLTGHFVDAVCRREGRETMAIEPGVLDLVEAYPWPGNVRELQNICERAVVLAAAAGEATIRRSLVEPWLTGNAALAPAPTPAPARTLPAAPPAVSVSNGSVPTLPAVNLEARPAATLAAATPESIKPESIKPLADVEREVIVTTLQTFGGHRVRTAKALGIGVRTLGLKLKKWKEEELVPQTL